ncbi:MAG: M28 family metallopeptidase [Steroidobacteraceae bacterium]
MRFWGHLGIFAGAGLLVAACAVQPKLPPPSTDIDETVFRTHVRMLASDDFEGRKPGTTGEEKTVAYLVEQFRKLGLKPGNGESFLQPVPMVESVAAADASLTVSGSGATLTLAYGKDMVIWSKRAQPLAELKHSGLVFAGYGIVAPEYAWNDYAGIDVHGKTVVVLINDPGYAAKDPKVFKGGTMTYYGRWDYKIEEAVRQGAAGVLLIHDTDAAGYGWQVVQNTWTGAQLSLAAADPNAGHAAIEGWIHKDAARALFSAAGLDFAAEAAAAAHAGFKAVSMGAQADATLKLSVREFTSNNVVALWPGGSRRHEYVLYTAHWDHLGRDPARAGHNVFNGAVEDASGVAGLLALGQSFIRTKPVADRSIVFVAFTGGEAGLLGSEYYVEHPVFPLRDTAAALNLDGLRNGGPTRDVTLFGIGNTDLEQLARAAALLQGREVTAEPQPEQGLYFRSDNFSFANGGVPALYERGGLDDTARGPIWGRAQLEDYMAHRYRQPTDQYSPDWDVRGALDDLRLYYEVGLRVARSRRFPRWYSNSEFRVSRDTKAAP